MTPELIVSSLSDPKPDLTQAWEILAALQRRETPEGMAANGVDIERMVIAAISEPAIQQQVAKIGKDLLEAKGYAASMVQDKTCNDMTQDSLERTARSLYELNFYSNPANRDRIRSLVRQKFTFFHLLPRWEVGSTQLCLTQLKHNCCLFFKAC